MMRPHKLHIFFQPLIWVDSVLPGRQTRDGSREVDILDDALSQALTYSRTLLAELIPPVLRDEGKVSTLLLLPLLREFLVAGLFQIWFE